MIAAAEQVHRRGSGNRCGHDPNAPRRFELPPSHANCPRLIHKFVKVTLGYYYEPRRLIPSLDTANGSDRQQRSERREASVILLGCVACYTDLETMRVGIPQPDGSMSGLTVSFFAKMSGLSERRTERTFRDFKAAGLMTFHPICKRLDDCTYKGMAAIRTLSPKVFELFGLGRWLRHERDKAAARRRKKRRKAEAAEAAKVALPLGRIAARKPRATEPAAEEPARKNAPTPMAEFFAGIKVTLKGGRDPP